MRKTILFAFILLGTVFAQGQNISKNAIGLRLGDNDGFGGEVSYQRGLSKNNRLEFDLGWRDSNHYDAVKLIGLYQWVWNIDGGFNWYAGIGGGVGSYDRKYNDDRNYDNNGVFAFAAADIGIEYNFDFPLLISLDFRPEFGGNGYYENNYGSDVALALRYQF